jgi:hypothetical protein
VPHDLGRGDPKIAMSDGIAKDRVGKHQHLDVGGAPAPLLDRCRRLLDLLGYAEGKPTTVPAASRADVTSVEELFAVHFPRQLTRYAHRVESGTRVLGISVTGPGGGRWAIRVDANGASIVAGEEAPFCVTVSGSDLLSTANRRLSVADLRARLRFGGDVTAFDPPLGERLMWTLLGEDCRPVGDAIDAS